MITHMSVLSAILTYSTALYRAALGNFNAVQATYLSHIPCAPRHMRRGNPDAPDSPNLPVVDD
jgi:hypothetical protein